MESNVPKLKKKGFVAVIVLPTRKYIQEYNNNPQCTINIHKKSFCRGILCGR